MRDEKVVREAKKEERGLRGQGSVVGIDKLLIAAADLSLSPIADSLQETMPEGASANSISPWRCYACTDPHPPRTLPRNLPGNVLGNVPGMPRNLPNKLPGNEPVERIFATRSQTPVWERSSRDTPFRMAIILENITIFIAFGTPFQKVFCHSAKS